MAELTVSNLTELYSALGRASGGDVILLKGGDYGTLNMSQWSAVKPFFSSEVTIKSLDANNPAVFSQAYVGSATNLTFDGIKFDYTYKSGDPDWQARFEFTGCQNLTLRNCTFDGDVAKGVSAEADGYGNGLGLSITQSQGVTLVGNEIYGFTRGLYVNESSNVRVIGNELHDLRTTGMCYAEVSNVLIENNYIHDMNYAPTSIDHPDMLQFWSMGADNPSKDVTIRGNFLDIGEGDWTQSIFIRNELVDMGLAGTEMFYQNFLIENNTIVNGHLHGIEVGETNGLIIRNNSVLHADGGNVDGADNIVEIPLISVKETSTNVQIIQNITSNIFGWKGQAGWTVSDNMFVQDQNPQAPGYYGNLFTPGSLLPTNGVNLFLAQPGGVLDRLKVGSSLTLGLEPFTWDDQTPQPPPSDPVPPSSDGIFLLTMSGGSFVGDAGLNWIVADGASSANVDLQLGWGKLDGGNTAWLKGIENASGGTAGDVLGGEDGTNSLQGRAGNDVLDGRGGNDVLDGGIGSDTLHGGTGNDQILSGDGDDSVVLDLGDDVVQGGAGSDWLIMSGTAWAKVDLSVATAQATGYGTDTISGIENLSGGSAADQLLGDLVGNILLGLGGNDRINGREGADMLDGGAGSDTVDGGTGNDLILAGDGDDSVVLDAGDDVVMGGAGVDWLQVSGTTGIRLDLSLTTAQATGFGSDTISGIENVGGSSAADQILGDSVANVLRGHGGNDQLNGRGGTDTLIGGAGADTLAGGADTVRDVFMFTSVKDSSWGGSGRSADIVQQFTSGIDVIDLSGIDANTRVSGDQAFQFSGTSARAYSAWYVADSAGITLRADVSGDNKADLEIRLVDVQALTASDFLL